MPACDARLVIGSACALWAAGEPDGLLPHFVDDVVFAVHARPRAPSILGQGLGRALLQRRLETLLDDVEVLSFRLQRHSYATDGIWHYSRATYRYRHHASGMIIEGSMRNRWGFVGNKIALFEAFHDADLMRAFLDVAGLAACDAKVRV